MNTLVLLKQTFDTEEKLVIENGKIKEDQAQFIINPYDEYAVEEAIRWKEEIGGEVTVITVGPPRAESVLRTTLAMGADHAIHIDSGDQTVDEVMVAKMISRAIEGTAYDLILAGNMSIDSGAGQVAIRLAENLGIPHVSTITKLTIEGTMARMERDVEGDLEVVEVPLPLLATAQQGLNEPRYPSLPGIMKAKKKPVKRITLDELGLNPQELEAFTVIKDQYLPAKKQEGRILQGDMHQQVNELIYALRNEQKVV